jgi:membrane protein implicated in regulation of membrane protease activity
MATVDPKNSTRRILWMVVLDVVVISFLSWLTVEHGAPLYPTAVIVYPALFVINLLVIWSAYHRETEPPTKGIRISKLAWFGVAAFTAGCVVQTVYWIKEPDLRSTTQAVVGIVLAGFAWFLVYRVSRFNKNRARQRQQS